MYNYIALLDSQEHSVLFIFLLASFGLSTILLIVSLIIGTHNPYYEKISAYECGFEPFEDARNKFDVKFYIVAILFLIFDVEVLFLLPWLLNLQYIGLYGFWCMILFLILLGFGFVYEVVKGALDW